ncbi:MAG: pentapeptide repeat-containing protein [Cyanobacteria bacterium J06576_12]
MATPFSSGKPNSSDPSRSGADSAAEAPSSAANSSANASANDFESELMSDFPNRKTPAWRADGTALPSQSLPKGTVPTTANAADTAASNAADAKARYNDSFTVDYNPDPDLQADNEDIQTHPLNRTQLNGQSQSQSKSQLSNKNGASGVVQERYQRQPAINPIKVAQAPISVVAIASALVVVIGFTLASFWLILAGSVIAFVVSLRLMAPTLQEALSDLTQQQRALLVALPGLILGIIGLIYTSGISRPIARWGSGLRWDIISALGDFLGAIGQIFIAVLAVYVAWRHYIISRDLTVQQNLITQQQTIDSYFQGISELVLDDEGLLEDWPQERVIAEARTAAILSSVDAGGRAKVLRFLSRSKLLTPLARDQRLGRPILDGLGGYAEDRLNGTRVIDLGVMLAASQMVATDLRWLDLSDANLIRADLTDCDLVRTNFARAILCDANLTNTDIMGVRLFYGELETATPRTRQDVPDYATGEFTGAVVEGADVTNVQRLSEVQRCYLCAWGGSKTRGTIPGGCEGIPNRLGR